MSGNTIGKLFTVTSFGESHGPAIGCIVDGCPPGLELTEADLQADLDRRKPGTSRHTTQRREADDEDPEKDLQSLPRPWGRPGVKRHRSPLRDGIDALWPEEALGTIDGSHDAPAG